MDCEIANIECIPAYSCIKRSLNSILDCEQKELIVNAINDRVICATRIAGLGSLYTQYKVYSSIEDGDFGFFERDPIGVITECYNSFLPGSDVQWLEEDFRKFIHNGNEYKVQWPVCRLLSNITKYLIDVARVNFENNIKLHAKKRIKLFFTICDIEANQNEIESTIKFMFESNSDCEPKYELINAIPNIGELQALNIDITQRDFFGKLLAFNWFKTVFIFVAIQMEVYDHQKHVENARKENPGLKIKMYRNFMVVPLCSQERRHIKIDNDVFHCILKELKIDPKRRGKKKNQVQIPIEDFIKNKKKHWFTYFDEKKFKQMEKEEKKFYYEIDTDGISASILFENKHTNRHVKSDGYIDTIAEEYSLGEFDVEVGIDLGYKNPIAGVIREPKTGLETNFKVTSRQFHASTGCKKRERIAKKLAGPFEKLAEADRQNRDEYSETPSPMGPNWFDYIVHRLKMFDDAIETYTNPK